MTTTQVTLPARRALTTLTLALLVLGSGLAGCVVAPYPRHGGGGRGGGGGYEEDGGVVVVEPPPVRMERPGPPPAVGYLWIDGFWNWSGGRHVWMPGHWEPRRSGQRWEPHRWERGQRGWQQRGGKWHGH